MPEIYHNTIETKVVSGLEGVRSIFDDMLVYGKNRQEHDQRLNELLKR
jgi:hypothetical protein